jgi:hypothetical protein
MSVNGDQKMKRQLVQFAVLSFLLHWLSATCVAQLVVVRPGYVKAPFVRVYSYPDGSSYVRAPFVGVHSPGRRLRAFYRQGELIPTPENMGQLDWKQLRRALRQSAADLDAQLSRFPTREVWRSHFNTATIRDLVVPDNEAPPTVEEQVALIEILLAFDESAESSDLRAITNLYTFRVLHAALREYVTPVELRLQNQLVTSIGELHRALGELSTGAGWQKYLALPSGVIEQGDTLPNRSAVPSEADIAELEKSLDRYDSVSQTHEYRMIASLPQFRATHDRLRSYVDLFGEQTPPQNLQAVEELPTPTPESPFEQQ